MKELVVFFLLIAALAPVQAACNPDVAQSTPASRFQISGENAMDQVTGLVWKRCPVGFTLDDNGTADDASDDACNATGQIEFTWAEAMALSDATWRLPNIKELSSIVERSCETPATNPAVFPSITSGTPAGGRYWSTTPFQSGQVANTVYFSTGARVGLNMSATCYVRLVQK